MTGAVTCSYYQTPSSEGKNYANSGVKYKGLISEQSI